VRAADPSKLQGVKELLGDSAAGLKGARAASFSGTDKGPDVPLEWAGTRPIRTIWGYIAWRLAGEAGMSLLAGSEDAATNPGAEALEKVLRAPGAPVLILLDEIVAYVRQLGGERYEAALSFFQSLTEAATRVPQALIVGSLPQSADEVGGARGRETLERLEKLFGRLQSSWRPAQGAETYAIVRRRLFQELDEKGERARDKTIEAYRKVYRDNKRDFPAGVDEATYAELMREAYPVHPLLFDTLAQDPRTVPAHPRGAEAHRR
jgi:predicted AAA+ superfamily ATPase